MGIPKLKMDGLYWTILLEWMICGYPYFTTHFNNVGNPTKSLPFLGIHLGMVENSIHLW